MQSKTLKKEEKSRNAVKPRAGSPSGHLCLTAPPSPLPHSYQSPTPFLFHEIPLSLPPPPYSTPPSPLTTSVPLIPHTPLPLSPPLHPRRNHHRHLSLSPVNHGLSFPFLSFVFNHFTNLRSWHARGVGRRRGGPLPSRLRGRGCACGRGRRM